MLFNDNITDKYPKEAVKHLCQCGSYESCFAEMALKIAKEGSLGQEKNTGVCS